MPSKEFISIAGLLREIHSRFPSNPPKLCFACLRDFECCSNVSRYQIVLALQKVLRTSGLRLEVDLTPIDNTRECATLILRVAKALCGHFRQSTLTDLHGALYYTVSIFHFHISPAPASVAQAQLRSVSYEEFLHRYEAHRVLGFRYRRTR